MYLPNIYKLMATQKSANLLIVLEEGTITQHKSKRHGILIYNIF